MCLLSFFLVGRLGEAGSSFAQWIPPCYESWLLLPEVNIGWLGACVNGIVVSTSVLQLKDAYMPMYRLDLRFLVNLISIYAGCNPQLFLLRHLMPGAGLPETNGAVVLRPPSVFAPAVPAPCAVPKTNSRFHSHVCMLHPV